jgi:hypothetical protein
MCNSVPKEEVMASAEEGFGHGCGCVFGVVFALILLLGTFLVARQFVGVCGGCLGSGKCSWCDGSGEGVWWGECYRCRGNKKCTSCGGSGWKFK